MIKECEICGKEYKVDQSRMAVSRFCGRDCWTIDHKRKQKISFANYIKK